MGWVDQSLEAPGYWGGRSGQSESTSPYAFVPCGDIGVVRTVPVGRQGRTCLCLLGRSVLCQWVQVIGIPIGIRDRNHR
eukprot:7944718-Pyramimonas_sp.AAC.2